MNIKNRALSLLVPLVLASGCQSDNVVSIPKAPSNSEFDPAIVAALHSYSLSPSDLSTGQNAGQVTQKTVTVGNENIVYFETSVPRAFVTSPRKLASIAS